MKRTPLKSWLMAGFEASAMTFRWTPALENGRANDAAWESGHLARAEEDYRLVAAHGLSTVRDALNWRRIEIVPGAYDWSSFVHMLRAADRAGVQGAWDLCHFGTPDHADPFAPDFADRFAAYARAAAHVFAAEIDAAPIWCPVNEISYWAYAGGEKAHFAPYGAERGHELKRALCQASIAAAEALLAVDPRARLLHVDPVMHAVSANGPDAVSEHERSLQFDAWDMIAGRKEPDLGGLPSH